MAFQAHKADLVPYEHPGIGRSVRFVTGRASTYAGGHVLERKRSPLVSVAGEASLFVGVSCLQLTLPGAPVRCMAVHTTNRTLAEAMVDADVFVGVSVKGVVTQDMLRTMGSDPVVMAICSGSTATP